MASKFIRSFFNTAERRKSSRYEDDEDKNPPLPLGRKLSISRSGRMKQANKKRHSLSMDVYNQEIQMSEKPKNTEMQAPQGKAPPATEDAKTEVAQRRSVNIEEEIDTAFEIINKTIITDL